MQPEFARSPAPDTPEAPASNPKAPWRSDCANGNFPYVETFRDPAIRPDGLTMSLGWHLSALMTDRVASRRIMPAFVGFTGTTVVASLLLTSQPLSPTDRVMAAHARDGATPAAALAPAHSREPFVPAAIAAPDHAKPVDTANYEIARPFIFQRAATDRDRALDCLATAAWYEAGNDPAGQRAVIQVVLNRVRHPNFPKSVCAVVFQGSERKTGCQFSFTCDGSLSRRFPAPAQWASARMLGENALNGATDTTVRQSTHFHANYVSPWWSSQLERISTVGAHIFYRWPGARGKLSRQGQPTGDEPDISVRPGTARPAEIAVDDTLIAENGFLNARSLPPASGAAGAVTAPPSPQSATLFMTVDEASPGGRWAMSALGKCSGKPSCQVVAYGQIDQTVRNRELAAALRDRPLFLFVRDNVSGMDLALWDCERAPRANASQCLPSSPLELTRLMRER